MAYNKQGECEVVDSYECSLWAVLCVVEFHRFHEDHSTRQDLHARRHSSTVLATESALIARDFASRGSLYRKLNPFPEASPLQREGWHIKLTGRA
jgi:hypothetical protein